MDRVLITGAMGFIGSHLTERLLQLGKEVWALDLFEPPFARSLRAYRRFHMVVDTIKNRPVLEKLVDRVDLVCHLAAVACPEEYVKHPRKVMDVSLLSALELVEMVRLTGKRMFFTSTSEIYGRNPQVPFAEDSDRVLGSLDVNRWCYSTSKAAVEHYMKACHDEGQLDYLIVRLFNAYGQRLRDRVVSRYVDAAIEGDPLVVHGDGRQTRCFTYIDDVIDAFILLLHEPSAWNASYNIGNPRETSILELARTALRIAGASPELIRFVPHFEAIGNSYEDIQRRVPDVSRVERAVGWSALTSLDDGLRAMIDHRTAELGRGPRPAAAHPCVAVPALG